MKYTIKEIFGPTIQGEGGMTGVVCAFVRFAGCNMWDGRPETRADSQCPFCDTDFFKGEKMEAIQIVRKVKDMNVPWVTLSGGEPMLQLVKDPYLIWLFHRSEIKVAIETNGTIFIESDIMEMIDHVTVSPKVPPSEIKQHRAHTLKVLYPHPRFRMEPENFTGLIGGIKAENHYVQPIEPPDGDPVQWQKNIEAALEYCYANPQWKLSAQVHKWLKVE